MADTGFSDWNQKLLNGESIIGLVKDFTAEQFAILGTMQGIHSLVFMPVFTNGKLVGAMGFDDCTNDRIWESEEIQALRLAASVVGVLCYP